MVKIAQQNNDSKAETNDSRVQKRDKKQQSKDLLSTKMDANKADNSLKDGIADNEDAKGESEIMSYDQFHTILEIAYGIKIRQKIDNDYKIDLYLDKSESKRVLESLGNYIWLATDYLQRSSIYDHTTLLCIPLILSKFKITSFLTLYSFLFIANSEK